MCLSYESWARGISVFFFSDRWLNMNVFPPRHPGRFVFFSYWVGKGSHMVVKVSRSRPLGIPVLDVTSCQNFKFRYHVTAIVYSSKPKPAQPTGSHFGLCRPDCLKRAKQIPLIEDHSIDVLSCKPRICLNPTL